MAEPVCVWCGRVLEWGEVGWVHRNGGGIYWQQCPRCGWEGSRRPAYRRCPRCGSYGLRDSHCALPLVGREG